MMTSSLLRLSCSSRSVSRVTSCVWVLDECRPFRPVVNARSFGSGPLLAHSKTVPLKRLSIGIRREAKNHWERRVPLVPDDVERLVKELGAKVYVQPSTKRVIPDEKYQQAGAIIHEDLSLADVILGVKEVPVKQLIPKKTYLFFSHTHKGQKYNMPLLKTILDKNIHLVDYELMTNEHGRRLVQFSKFAGYAGMVDGLHVMGHRLLALGFGSPFLAIGMSYMYRALADARLDVTRTGQVIADDGLPKELGPMTFVFTGDGNVTRGAEHVFKCLPHEWVSPNDMAALATSTSFDNHKVYACKVTASDYLVRNDGKPFDMHRYLSHPEEFHSVFHEKIAPYARMIVNGIFWTDKYPRLLTIDQIRQLALEKRHRLLTIADISCDINGSLEFMSEATTIDSPFFLYDPLTNSTHRNIDGPGIQIMSIDNLPTEMPLEASEYFSDALVPYISELVKGNLSHPVVERASITTSKGELVERHKHLAKSIEKHGQVVESKDEIKVMSPKRVLLLGSGYVAAPLVDYLAKIPTLHLTIGTNNVEEGRELARTHSNVSVVPLDIHFEEQLSEQVSQHDLAVSFVPATFHPLVAQSCLTHKTHLVTASYISPAMMSLHEQAKAHGVTFLNEIGLDPGIDHLTACQFFDHVRAQGGRIKSFVSWCGGLPAPEASDNPLGYKFSWSPKAVLLASQNTAKFKRDGKIWEIPGQDLLRNAIDVPIFKGFSFEGLANRDSLKYVDFYKLGPLEDMETMFRGTLRYKGFSELLDTFSKLGFLQSQPFSSPPGNWEQVTSSILGTDPIGKIASVIGVAPTHPKVQQVWNSLVWLGATSADHLVPASCHSILDAFVALLESNCEFGPNERDMVAMRHEFGVEWKDGSRELHSSTLIVYGDPTGYSAMAKTVGLPAAIAAELILQNKIQERGVLAPMSPEIYNPILKRLAKEGIVFKETVTKQ